MTTNPQPMVPWKEIGGASSAKERFGLPYCMLNLLQRLFLLEAIEHFLGAGL